MAGIATLRPMREATVDPSPDQWRQISAALKKGSHHIFFDSAYQVRGW